jgi:hypothetical protein
MRGIFAFLSGVSRPRLTPHCLPLALALLLMQAASAQDVTIELTPITYPIVLPDSGGSFDYLLTVTNQGGTPITATVWCSVTMPSGNSRGPALGPVTQTLNAGQIQVLNRTQIVPPRATYGYYLLHAYVGIYPDTIWAQDQFEFQHQAISGTEQEWVARYNGPGNGLDEAHAINVDDSGNVYVTGYSYGSGANPDYATIKYGPYGNQIWAARYNGPGNYQDAAYSIALDAAGNVYVTGYSYGSGNDADYATIKYDANGNQVWVARYTGPGNFHDQAHSLALDATGNVYVTGWSYGSATHFDYTTIKYDGNGNHIWVARYNGPGNLDDEAYSLGLDAAGNVYVTGHSYGSGTNYDYATIKYDGDGNQIWVERYNGPGNGYDLANSLALDAARNVYVTGLSVGSGTNGDYATIKYDADGNQLWVARYNGPGNILDEAYSLALDAAGNVYVTGGSTGSDTQYDYATIKYSGGNIANWMPVEATVLGQPLPQEFALHQNYPNPFNAVTALS